MDPGITFTGLKEHVTPAGSGGEHEKATFVLKLPLVGEAEIANIAVPPAVRFVELGAATDVVKSSPIPEKATVAGFVFEPLCPMVSVPALGPVTPALNATVTVQPAFGARLMGSAPQSLV